MKTAQNVITVYAQQSLHNQLFWLLYLWFCIWSFVGHKTRPELNNMSSLWSKPLHDYKLFQPSPYTISEDHTLPWRYTFSNQLWNKMTRRAWRRIGLVNKRKQQCSAIHHSPTLRYENNHCSTNTHDDAKLTHRIHGYKDKHASWIS